MNIKVNGSAREVAEGTTLAELVESVTATPRGCAVAVDGDVVPRSNWPDWKLAEGEQVEVLVAVQGG